MLYLVATPIGNLEDVTLRALKILQSCDYILCEDTRHSQIFLSYHGIHRPLKSFHKFNEASREEEVIQDLLSDRKIAVISDAGTPGISDPGSLLVQRCIKEKIPVSPIPGPCAFVVALTCSGLNTNCFQFIGFLPKKTGELRQALQEAFTYRGTTACYESPNRILKTLQMIEKMAPTRLLTVAREITKKFEEYCHGTASELSAHWEGRIPKGEFVLLIDGFKPQSDIDWSTFSPQEHVVYLEENWGLSHKEALKMVAAERNIPKRLLYKQLLSPQ
jgi:16S rRNA (cytidine1402-2'-O)-methyltransferase